LKPGHNALPRDSNVDEAIPEPLQRKSKARGAAQAEGIVIRGGKRINPVGGGRDLKTVSKCRNERQTRTHVIINAAKKRTAYL
jgi:hypothetical protein